jgi:hypothetical protein
VVLMMMDMIVMFAVNKKCMSVIQIGIVDRAHSGSGVDGYDCEM